MELEEDGKSIIIERGSTTLVGRETGVREGSGSSDRSISRRHVSFQLLFMDTMDDLADSDETNQELVLSFEVIGKNPILVISKDGLRKGVLKKSEKGVLKAGDRISLSIKNPNFFLVKRREKGKDEIESGVFDAVARRERRTRQRMKEAAVMAKLEETIGEDKMVWEDSGLEISSLDISKFDPVKEFGFLRRGHEFDHYPKHKILPFKDWNWFLEDTKNEVSEDDEEDEAVDTKMKGKNKRQKKKNCNDEDWAEMNDDENNLRSKMSSAKRTRISTRSKDSKKPCVIIQGNKNATQKKKVDNEENETLGGFIVDDDDIEEEEMLEDEEVLEEEESEEEDEDDEGSDVD